MRYEVEQKFPVADLADVQARLEQLGARFQAPVCQSDGYYRHPARDFRQTDEALRIRRVGDANFVTYKGPKVDQTTKTRREIELPLPGGDEGAERFGQLLLALGFQPAAGVHKTRRTATLLFQDRPIEIALDVVDGLGAFVELESVADEAELPAAKAAVLALADELALTVAERRSYLELLDVR